MELSPKQQVTELFKKFSNVLLVTHARPDGDAIGSLLALSLVLEKLGKQTTPVVLDPVPGMLEFLPALNKLQQEAGGSSDLVVSIDITKTPVDKLKYNTRDGHLNVVISPKEGAYTSDDVKITAGGTAKFDLVVVLDAPDLDRIGSFYEDNPELFYDTPVVNIDHHPSNDYFGAVNLVDLTATSTSEILVGVIEALGDSLITEDVATLLLTGLITDTGSFQNSNTTPKSLTVSAQLVAAGGRQQEIVQHVYKTRPLSTLKLWGRALTKLQYDADTRVVWSSLTKEDFAETGGTATEAKAVIDALMSSAPDAEVIVLLRESDAGKVDGSVRTVKGVDATKIVGIWNGGGHTGAAGFDVLGALSEVEQDVIGKIQDWQRKRLDGNDRPVPKQGVKPKVPAPPKRAVASSTPPQPAAAAEEPQPTPPTVEEALKVAQAAGTAKEGQANPNHQLRDRDMEHTRPTAPVSDQAPPPTPTQPPVPVQTAPQGDDQQPLTDDQLDAFFRKSGGSQGVIDQRTDDA